MSGSPAKVISVTSGKGGVGKTNVAVNLGIALTKLGKQVLLLDADLGLANVNVILGFEPRANIGDVLSGKSSMDDIIVHHESGLDIIPSTSGIVEMTHLGTEEQLALVSAVDDLAQEYDFLIVDTAAGIGDNVLYFNMAAEEIIVVVDGQPTSMTDAYAVVKVLSQRCGVKEFNVLTNRMPVGSDGRTTYAQLAMPVSKFLPATSLKFLGSIQEDSAVTESVLRQRAYVDLYPSSRASLDIGRIAKKMADEQSSRVVRGNLQFFFKAIVEHS